LILQLTPVTGISELELQSFFGSVADQIDIPIAIQNAPDYLGIGLSLGDSRTSPATPKRMYC